MTSPTDLHTPAGAASPATDHPAVDRDYTLDHKFTRTEGRIYLSGVQALVRLPLMQRLRDQAAGRLGSTPDGLDLVQERAILARHQGGIAQMKLAELRGELIQVAAVKAVWAARLTSARDALLQIPPRLAPVLAAENNLTRVNQLLEDEIRQALAELSGASEASRQPAPT